MTTNVREIMRQIDILSPEELDEVKREIESRVVAQPQGRLGRALRDAGLVREPRLPRDPNRPINPVPIVVKGKPLSESLIEERR